MLVVQQDDDGKTYQLNIFADIFNEQLRRDGKPLQFYYLPDEPRLARNDNGDYMFHFTKFAGVLTADDNIAVASPGQVEVAGGVVAFTSTLKIPDQVILAAIDQIRQSAKNDSKYRDDKLFSLGDGNPEINLGVVPIVDNVVTISNLTTENITDPNSQKPDDPWLWKMQGEGKGTINPVGNNAYTAMVGQYPAQIIESAFHGASSPIFVHNALKHKFYTGAFTASIHGDWNAIYNHFSADLKASYFFVKGDIQAAFNSAVKNGVITRKITIDNEILSPEKEKQYEAQVDKVFDKFMEAAQKTIFDPAPPKIENAKAADTGAVGVSFALKIQHDETHLTLDFNEEIDETYIKDNVISAHLMGFYDVLKNDPSAEKKYFDTVHLDEGFRKIHVIASARAFWPDASGNGGDPVEQLVLQVGYPDSTGAIVYKDSGLFMENAAAPKSTTLAPAIWTKDNKSRIFIFDFERQSNLPPDQVNTIYVKRQVRYQERSSVEIPNRTLTFPEAKTTDHAIEVAADALGTLRVGPVQLDTKLDDRTKAMVTFRKANRNPETLRFTSENLKDAQYFEAWTADPANALNWSYQVTIIIESKVAGLPAISYSGPEIPQVGSSPLIALVPQPPDNLKDQIKHLKDLGATLGTDF
jgi:hypothetical protein